MANLKISDVTAGSALTGTELFETEVPGTGSRKHTADQIGDRVLAYLRDTDTSLAANSDSKFATQKAMKAYADALIAANDAMVFKGVIDCSANPNYPAANRGDTYRVSVAGKIGGGSGPNVEVGDLLLCLTDSTSSGTHGSVGSSWSIAQTNLDGAVIGPSSVSDGQLSLFDGTSGKLLKGATMSGDATLSGSGVLTVANDAISNAKLANMATKTYKGRTSGSTGDPEDVAVATVRADLGEKVSALTDGATISVDASLANNFRVTLGGNRTLANPTGLIDGQVLNFRISQDGTGSRTLSYGSKYKWPGGTAGVLSTAASAKDLLSCQYDATDDTLFCVLNKAFA